MTKTYDTQYGQRFGTWQSCGVSLRDLAAKAENSSWQVRKWERYIATSPHYRVVPARVVLAAD